MSDDENDDAVQATQPPPNMEEQYREEATNLTVPKLKKFLAAKGVDVSGKPKKGELVEQVVAYRLQGEEEGEEEEGEEEEGEEEEGEEEEESEEESQLLPEAFDPFVNEDEEEYAPCLEYDDSEEIPLTNVADIASCLRDIRKTQVNLSKEINKINQRAIVSRKHIIAKINEKPKCGMHAITNCGGKSCGRACMVCMVGICRWEFCLNTHICTGRGAAAAKALSASANQGFPKKIKSRAPLRFREDEL